MKINVSKGHSLLVQPNYSVYNFVLFTYLVFIFPQLVFNHGCVVFIYIYFIS